MRLFTIYQHFSAAASFLFSYTVQRGCVNVYNVRTAILKNNSTAEKRREEEAFALKSIAHYCFVEIKSNCVHEQKPDTFVVCPSI